MPTFGGIGFGGGAGGVRAATFDEGASTNSTFYTLTDPDGDGKNYRCAEFLSDGTLVIASTGFVQMWMGASGQNGYNSGQSAVFGSGGNYGGVMEVRGVVAENGTFTVHVGDPSALGAGGVDPSKVTGPFSGFNHVVCGTYQWSSGSTYAYRGYQQTLPTVDFNSPPSAYYTVGTAGGGAQAGRPGYGGNGGGGGGGAAGTVTGWTTNPFLWGQGGGGSYTTTQQPANTGNGGPGSQLTSFGKGGTGRVYIRVEL